MRDLHPRDILRILKKHRLLCLVVVLIVITGTLAVNLWTVPQFEATTKIVIERGQPDDLAARNQMLQRDPEFYETQYQLIKSRAVARRALDSIIENNGDLAEHIFEDSDGRSVKTGIVKLTRSLIGWAEAKSDDAELGPKSPREDVEHRVKVISRGIRVRPVENSRMINISFVSPDPIFAALVADSVVEAYIEELNDMKGESSRISADWMNRRAEAEKERLKKASQQLEKFVSEQDILTLENRIAVIPEKLTRISTELVGAELRRQQLQALKEKIDRIKHDPLGAESVPAILNDQALQSLRAQIVAAEKVIMELSGRFGPRHPEMQKAERDLDILKRKRDEEIDRIIGSIRNEYELALANEKSLQAQLEKTRAEAMVMNERFARYQSMKAELDRDRGLLDALALRANEAGITSDNQLVKLWIVENASIPQQPSSPNKKMNLAIGLVLGVFGGMGLAFFREYLDNTISNPDETELVFDTPVLGTISRHRGKEIETIALKEPLSAFAEGYRALRTTILASMGDCRRLLVTSPLAGEGKTATSVNLALSLAQTEMRILLIDGDLRKPRIHRVMGMNNQLGLSNLLARPFTRQSALGSIQKGPIPNLSILTSGPIPPNPSELLFSRRMDELMSLLESEFDLVVCDSPPILLVEDSRILSRIFQRVVLVTKAHQTTNEVVGRALKMLHDVKAPMLGFVINGLDQRKSEYYYHKQQYTDYQSDNRKKLSA